MPVVSWIEWIGFLAAAMTSLSFVPQVLLTWRTRDTRGISLGMYTVYTTGIAVWLLYGWLIDSWPMIVSNVVTVALAASILAMKVHNRERDRAAAAAAGPSA